MILWSFDVICVRLCCLLVLVVYMLFDFFVADSCVPLVLWVVYYYGTV